VKATPESVNAEPEIINALQKIQECRKLFTRLAFLPYSGLFSEAVIHTQKEARDCHGAP